MNESRLLEAHCTTKRRGTHGSRQAAHDMKKDAMLRVPARIPLNGVCTDMSLSVFSACTLCLMTSADSDGVATVVLRAILLSTVHSRFACVDSRFACSEQLNPNHVDALCNSGQLMHSVMSDPVRACVRACEIDVAQCAICVFLCVCVHGCVCLWNTIRRLHFVLE